ncbi:MAG TPA: YicC family protein [Chitinophagaceae bacterium]|nr:YicC family protein [Chitinophagaceae bacterium]
MLFSMTGFGRAEQTIGDKNFIVDIRSLNGKQLDVRLTLPSLLKPYEIDIRNRIAAGLERGSVECSIYLKQNGAAKSLAINTDLVAAYYEPLQQMAAQKGWNVEGVLAAILRMPEVVAPPTEILSEAEYHSFIPVLSSAIEALNQHRKEEGAALEVDLLQRITAISQHQAAIQALAPNRRTKIKEGLVKLLEEQVGPEHYDANRLEQELIYYIEKIDISEEQVRLSNHLQYFKTMLQEPDKGKGKKLSFIIQEIGREINTTGSKAYDADIQKIVVLMKDELEKAKEQILNVL